MAVNHVLEPESGNQAITFPILKFSHSTTSTARTSPLPWTHLSGGRDLAAVFEHTQVLETTMGWTKDKRAIKFLRGGEKLDEVDLDFLAQLTSSSASAGGSQFQSQKPLAAIVVKSPILAIRYPLGANQVRRFQAKFASGDDFNKVLSVLTEAGCSVMESNIDSNTQLNTPHPIPPSPVTVKGTGSLVSIANSGCVPLESQSQSWRPLSSNVAETRPSSTGSSVTLASVDPSQARFAEPRPSSMGSLITSPAVTRLNIPRSSSSVGWPQPHNNGEFQNTPPTSKRIPDVETLDELLPPRRELPFARSTKKNVAQPAAQRPKINQKPAMSQMQHSQVQPRNSATQSNDVNSSLRFEAQSRLGTISAQIGGTEAQSEGQDMQVPQDGSILIPSDGMSPPKRPLDDISNTYQPSPTKAPCRENRSVQQNIVVEPSSQNPPPQAAPGNTASCQTSGNTSFSPREEVQQTRPLEKERGEPVSSTDFSAYLSTPSAERSALVESWVCQQLESDEFLALCQDVERVWKRIAFGM